MNRLKREAKLVGEVILSIAYIISLGLLFGFGFGYGLLLGIDFYTFLGA
ncbi:hypothetical protein [Thiomicrorhabdus sp. Kp2]|nr:hypothetical protein [Thiomicrorhabdus sp. Kp2]